MGTQRVKRGNAWSGRGVAAILLAVALAGAPVGTAAAAAGPGANAGGGYFPWPVAAEFATPAGDREVARRQALGCTVIGLSVTGLAMASGAMASVGTGGTAAVPVGTVVGEILTYFGAGCTIGAFLAGLFPSAAPATVEVADKAGG